MALSPICTADKVRLIICCGCYWGCLVWGNNILARLVNSVSLQLFPPPAFILCLRLSLHKPPNSLVSLAAFSSPFLKPCHFVSYRGPTSTPHTCRFYNTVALRVSLLMCGLLHTEHTCQMSTRRMFYTQLNSTLNWLTDRALATLL